ncbi:MAG: HD domain-containing protein [Deltaproteobacteria bacterium]|nr:HD domain-containing protein [Deltaproteobacteria bacterium]
MKKTRYLADIRPGDKVCDVFAVVEKSLGRKKDGGAFLTFRVSDRTGAMAGVAWEDVEAIKDAFVPGGFVHITGRAGEYRGEAQLIAEQAVSCEPHALDPRDFLPACPTDPEVLLDGLKSLAATVTDPALLALLDEFFADDRFVDLFVTAPAAKLMHHAYIGGLLEHTLSVARLADAACAHYPQVDRDLLITGAILHDIGKVKEFTWTSALDYSDAGRLLSHLVLGVQILDEKIAAVEGFPEDCAMLLRHLLVSHHGAREFGSPEPPKTVEAVILNQLDDMDAKVAGLGAYMKEQDGQASWSRYHRALERHIYLKGREKN